MRCRFATSRSPSVHNVEMKKGKGGQLVRSAGSGAALMARMGLCQLRLPSGEVRMIHWNAGP